MSRNCISFGLGFLFAVVAVMGLNGRAEAQVPELGRGEYMAGVVDTLVFMDDFVHADNLVGATCALPDSTCSCNYGNGGRCACEGSGHSQKCCCTDSGGTTCCDWYKDSTNHWNCRCGFVSVQ